MKKESEKNERRRGIAAIVFIACIIINFSGKRLASMLCMPFWLDSIGTGFAGWILGPAVGAAVGGLSNIIYTIVDVTTLPYAITGAILGFAIGECKKRGYFKEIFGVVSTSFIFGLICVVVSSPFNYFFLDGKNGNKWGDGLGQMLFDYNAPKSVCVVLGQAFIDIPDKILTMVIVYLGIKFAKYLRDKGMIKKIFICMVFFVSFACMRENTQAATIFDSDYVETIFNNENKMYSSEANDIVQTKDGYIWIGCYAGLYRYDGKHFQMFGKQQGITNVTRLFVDDKGRLIVGTNDSGVAVYEEGKFRCYSEKEGMPVNSVRSFAQDKFGNIYRNYR